MEKIIEIKGIEETEAKSGRVYYKVKTQEGIMSCFEDSIIKELKKCDIDEKKAKVEIATNERDGKTFKNIRKFIEATNDSVEVMKPKEFGNETTERKSVKGSPYEKDPVGLCVDLVIAGKTIEEAVEIVKVAKAAF